MAERRNKGRNLRQFVTLIVAVVIVVAVSVLFQRWWNDRPGTPPGEISVEASAGGRTVTVPPYSACEIDVECPEGEITDLEVGAEDTLTVTLPREVYDRDFSLLMIYDNPAANDQRLYPGNSTREVEVPGSVEIRAEGDGEETSARLLVVEIRSPQIGVDAEGNESPVRVIWSINAQP
ncbi:DUF2771 domain-containing protein [Corynebacterium pygosceleis]|uniref:DUF2771 domain-containing protein n=1 Tax=Corynebacterium pygosceleis TaxID=2800406 RepID=A0A9Q4GIY7_9CORY|nr:DUF2771 domain-containing protein [Corynebacterium pygosceleis]MCK7638187.1 DUF2771 domain-containing protein [Corynebacterium pygosceleis]MCK7675900.1 DUF2771 domain-containing protein [Corynebacterium pygosceleis]MCL0120718.1 DUF2771 domain-containing protein [Corynebacterium pygosceleis]MCX7444258.1 DUF2771 domain-containing protein [Corynebacterium pygosceleis]MCX7468903.1 DUF2771 domain-containing protein [Corynebacterium pygosceleis]